MKFFSMAEKAASTKAMEMTYPKEQRIYEDPYSVQFLTAFNRMFINMMKSDKGRQRIERLSEKTGPGVYGGIISRNRYMDDVLQSAIDEGFDAVVNLGGGYDSRCLRFEMKDMTYYHIDRPKVTDSFRKVLSKMPSGVPTNMVFVPIDFNTQRLEEELQKAGYDKSMKTLFLWEGVTQYIDSDAVTATLDYIAKTAAGSQVVFTYVLRDMIDNLAVYPEYAKMIKQVKMLGIKWVTGFNPEEIPELLEKHGLDLIEEVGKEVYEERYFKPIGREIAIMPIERIAYAKVK